ncbi:hypothetical protein EV126DRAFT_226674 [Verticillium dahliae]|nr:hypothetical protein EV126DRAFT_226674 [Verticillium dahliae]
MSPVFALFSAFGHLVNLKRYREDVGYPTRPAFETRTDQFYSSMAPALRMTRSIKEKLQIFFGFQFSSICFFQVQKVRRLPTITHVMRLVLEAPEESLLRKRMWLSRVCTESPEANGNWPAMPWANVPDFLSESSPHRAMQSLRPFHSILSHLHCGLVGCKGGVSPNHTV